MPEEISSLRQTQQHVSWCITLLLSPFIWSFLYLVGDNRSDEAVGSSTQYQPVIYSGARGRSSKKAKLRHSKTDTVSDDDVAIEDEQARVIADSLVTRAPPRSSERHKSSQRRSARLIRQQLENSHDALKSPTSSSSNSSILRKAKQKATTASRSLITNQPHKKTLILDLDETLIHSLSKGGTMSRGHMVEVHLGSHAILYYVHKRPYCDYFLDKVSQWFNLVIFTASVQEYADPVIDWLEQEKKYFKARFYRQHCTYRFGAYMKDLSIAETDLSRAIIVDNSPLSYRLNEENAIPIEGWISDPTDRDLIFLIPVLQGLRHVNDVRSLLSLRQPD